MARAQAAATLAPGTSQPYMRPCGTVRTMTTYAEEKHTESGFYILRKDADGKITVEVDDPVTLDTFVPSGDRIYAVERRNVTPKAYTPYNVADFDSWVDTTAARPGLANAPVTDMLSRAELFPNKTAYEVFTERKSAERATTPSKVLHEPAHTDPIKPGTYPVIIVKGPVQLTGPRWRVLWYIRAR